MDEGAHPPWLPAARNPWTGATSPRSELQRKYNLQNLELHQLPIERVGEIGRSFDLVVCTGVLHHLPDPDDGLRALRDVLRPGGAMRLMVYARYGRAGIYMMQVPPARNWRVDDGSGNSPRCASRVWRRLVSLKSIAVIRASGSRSAYLAACEVP